MQKKCEGCCGGKEEHGEESVNDCWQCSREHLHYFSSDAYYNRNWDECIATLDEKLHNM